MHLFHELPSQTFNKGKYVFASEITNPWIKQFSEIICGMVTFNFFWECISTRLLGNFVQIFLSLYVDVFNGWHCFIVVYVIKTLCYLPEETIKQHAWKLLLEVAANMPTTIFVTSIWKNLIISKVERLKQQIDESKKAFSDPSTSPNKE